jgi:tRNA(adenine34) deaminase
MITNDDAMTFALAEARNALAHGDVPVGAVVIHNDVIISSRHNERELRNDPTGHAEILALRDAANLLGRWRLEECTLVVTLEPCTMCAGALVNSRISKVVFGAADLKAGAFGSLYNIATDPRLGHHPQVVHGVLATQCAEVLTELFKNLRETKTN